jgi:signal peptidase
LKLPGPASIAVALVLLVSTAAAVLYETGEVPYRAYVVHTGSMSPTIPSESAVIVREGQYRVGDVVSFIEHGTVVSHRLIAIEPNGTITTKGDANRTVDPWHVPVGNIVGRVVAAPHRVGYLLTYMKTPAGCASLVVTLLCLWQIWALAAGISPRAVDGAALNGRSKGARPPAHTHPDRFVEQLSVALGHLARQPPRR